MCIYITYIIYTYYNIYIYYTYITYIIYIYTYYIYIYIKDPDVFPTIGTPLLQVMTTGDEVSSLAFFRLRSFTKYSEVFHAERSKKCLVTLLPSSKQT